MTSTPTHSTKLIDIADRLARLSPCHRDPERYHEEKSELVNELRQLAANDNHKPKVKRSVWL